MLPKTKKQKGKRLEKYIAKELKKIFKFVYSRADSGSGKFHKEDITLPDDVPLFIECKNQKEENITKWWRQTIDNCPESKLPVLIYKLNYQREPKVVMYLGDLLYLLSDVKTDLNYKIIMYFSDWLSIIKEKYANL